MLSIGGLRRLSVAFFVMTLVLLGGSGIASAQAIEPEDIGVELFPEGTVPIEDQAHLYAWYERVAGDFGLTVDEALAQGLTLTELETAYDSSVNSSANSEWVEVSPGVFEPSNNSSSGTLPSRSERGLIRLVGFGVFMGIASLFKAAKANFT